MQRVKVPYNPALDDGGGAPGAEPQRYIPGEIGDVIYTGHFESNHDAVHSFSYRKPQDLYMPQIPSGNPIPSFVPLHTQAPENLTCFTSYHYLRSHSSSLIEPNFSGHIHPSNDNVHSQSTTVAIQSNGYHPVSPAFSIGHASGIGSNGDAVRPCLTLTDYDRDQTSISPSQDESFDVSDSRLLECSQFYLFPAQSDADGPQVRNTHDLAASQGSWGYTPPLQPTPGPFMTASSPNVPIPTHSNTQENNTWFAASHPTLPQAIDMGFMMASPELQVHYASPLGLPPPSTEEPSFNSHQLYSPPTYPQGFQPRQETFQNCTPGDIFDPIGVGTAYQRAHLCGRAEKTAPPISEITISSLASLHCSPATWTGWVPRQQTGLSSSGLLIAANDHVDSPPQSLSSSSGVSGYIGQASGEGSSDGASPSSSTTMIQTGARTPATDPPDTPNYGGLNTFLSQRDTLSRVSERSRQCRPPVLKLDDCPPNLRRYFNTDIPIPPHECDTMYDKYGDKTRCIKCGYDVTPPRRSGLKYEHVSAHIENRPYYCLKCHHGFFRKSNHSKTRHPPLWRTTPPSSR